MKKFIKRFGLLIILLIGLIVVYATGSYHYLTFDSLKAHHQILKETILAHPVLFPVLFILIYFVCTALSVPGAIFLTLLGGYLFPQPWSTIYVVFAATCGAVAIFLAARTALGDALKKKAGPFLKKMEKGFRENAASYLLFLRFIPIFPFWAVNLAPAFFGVPLRTFIWTTALGIIPGSFVFTLAGGGLEKIFESQQAFSIGAIFNTQIKIALTLLAILSLAPAIVKHFRKK